MKILKTTAKALILSAFILAIGLLGKIDIADEIATEQFYNELAVQTQYLP